jgi:hypothetical protein
MLTITSQAQAYIKAQNKAIHLELPPMIDCCIHLQEAPMIRLGLPRDLAAYEQPISIDGIDVYFPLDFIDIDLTITLASFLGFKRLTLEGWRLA